MNTLVYFPLRGRAELIRMICHLGNIPYQMKTPDWPKDADQMPYGKLPLWKDADGFELAQSQTIARYLAKQANLVGTNAKEEAWVQSVQDAWAEIRDALVVIFFCKDETQKQELVAKLLDTLKSTKVFHERLLSKNSGPFYLGKTLSIADLACYDVVDQIKRIDETWAELLGAEINQIYAHVSSQLKPYLQSNSYLTEAAI